MFWSFSYLVCRCLLQLVLLRRRSEAFKELEIVVLRHELVGAAASGKATAAHDGRSRVACCGESAAAAAELAVVHGYASDTAALAPAARRPPLDLRRSPRSAADRGGDPCAGAAAGAREPALGLSADRGRTERARHQRLGDDSGEDPAPSGTWPCRRAFRALLACLPASAGAEHARGRLLHGRDDLAAAAVRALLHRARQPTRPPGRLYREPDRRLGHPAGPPVRLDTRRSAGRRFAS